ncbi:MAG: transketolase [Candidatus Bipolaricaulota bacterium]
MTYQELANKANELRATVLQMVYRAQSGHAGGGLGMADVLTYLYYGGVLRHDPGRPAWPGRDRFLLSNGHTCPILYSILADRGYLERDLLWTFRQLGSPLQGHPSTGWTVPGVELSSGSLGHGLSVGLGQALAARVTGADYRVFVSISDGECQEGQPWEAATAAVHHKVDNLCGILDWNRCQIDGPTPEVMDTGNLAGKFRAFGWHVQEIDGHNYEEIERAFRAFEDVRGSGTPTLIACHNVLGKGVSFMEGDYKWHHGAPSDEQLQQALAELGVSG